MTTKKHLGRRVLRAPLFVLVLGACSALPLNPGEDDLVADRIARHPEPWIVDRFGLNDANQKLVDYVNDNLAGRLFFLSGSALVSSNGGTQPGANDCLASGGKGKKNYALCVVRYAGGHYDPQALKLREQCTKDMSLSRVHDVHPEVVADAGSNSSKAARAPAISVKSATECNNYASGKDANFYSFDRDENVCLAVSVCVTNKSTIERDDLVIELKNDGEIGAAVATGGPRPM